MNCMDIKPIDMLKSEIKKIYDADPWLKPYREAIDDRHERILEEKERISAGHGGSL